MQHRVVSVHQVEESPGYPLGQSFAYVGSHRAGEERRAPLGTPETRSALAKTQETLSAPQELRETLLPEREERS